MRIPEPALRQELDAAIVATVAYSDVFDMPLERYRLERFLIGVSVDPPRLGHAVATLIEQGRLLVADNLLYLPGREEVLGVYAERTSRAAAMWNDAQVWGVRLGRLPFVRAVAVTGGLACDSVADHDDIDYLIVTEPGRLWLTRLFCVMLVQVGRRRGVDLCPNYLVAEDALSLEERTSYTARELAQMVDIVGSDVLDSMRSQNDWLLDYLPNVSLAGDTSRTLSVGRNPLRSVVEIVVRSRLFDGVEGWEMRRKVAKLQSVASRRPEVGRPDESSFSASSCKGHMVGNASGIEVAWRDRIERHSVGK